MCSKVARGPSEDQRATSGRLGRFSGIILHLFDLVRGASGERLVEVRVDGSDPVEQVVDFR